MPRIKVTVIGLYNFDNSLFDPLTVPEGVSKDDLILNILEKAGDLGLLYPDWNFMKTMIGVWSRNEGSVWEKLHETTQLEYNPIENYDRYDSIQRDSSGSTTGTSTNAQTAFNSDSMKDTDSNRNGSTAAGTENVESHMHGNIGVTSAMELIAQQRDIVQFTVIEFITRSFIDRFCIELY